MSYKVTKTVSSIAELIPECIPCCGISECVGPACKFYQLSKFLNVSCISLFYNQTDKVIEFLKGDIDIEKVEDFEESETPERTNENDSFVSTSKSVTIVI